MHKRVNWHSKVSCPGCPWHGEVEDLAEKPLGVVGDLKCPGCHRAAGEFEYNDIMLRGMTIVHN